MDFVVRYAEQKCTEKERRRLKIVELNKENMKKIRWLIAFSVLLPAAYCLISVSFSEDTSFSPGKNPQYNYKKISHKL